MPKPKPKPEPKPDEQQFWVMVFRPGGKARNEPPSYVRRFPSRDEARRWIDRFGPDGDRFVSDQPGLSAEEARVILWAQGFTLQHKRDDLLANGENNE